MKKAVCSLLLALCICAAYSQIGQKVKSPATQDLAGTWVMNVPNGNTVTLLLMANGNAELDGDAMTWTTNANVLQLKTGSSVIKYTFKQNGNSLTLSGGDLAQPATFVRNNTTGNNTQNSSPNGDAALLGTWQAQGMLFTFEKGGKMYYNDKTMDYTVSGNTLNCVNEQAGVAVSYQYQINQGHLMLTYNGNTIMLQKKSASTVAVNNGAADSKKPGFLGSWISNNNERLSIMEGGRLTLEGYDLTYTYDANTITITAPAGNVVFSYTLNGNSFNVTNNGVTTYYKRAGNNNTMAGANNSGGNGAGIDPTMVGRWGVMSSGGGGYNSSGSYSSSEYFILNANGTYQYYSEGSRSVSSNNQYGDETINAGTNSSGYDEGTWTVRGNVLIANSRKQGVLQYPFQKRNNKNGDPCIVINGTEYVSYYKKAPWAQGY